MKKSLTVTLFFCVHLSSATEEERIAMPDLTYEDDEDLYRQVFGDVEQQEEMLFDMDVLVDGEKSGSAPTLIGGKSKIQAAALKYCLSEYIEQEDINVIDKFKDEDGFVEFTDLNKLSLKTKLNRLSMQVEVFIPLEKKKERSLGGRRQSPREKPNTKPANVSAVVNLRASQSFDKGKFSSFSAENLIITPYVNLFGICVEGEGTYQHSTESKWKFHRDYTTVVYDWEKSDIIFRFGDVFSRTLSYQSPPRIWGIGINKEVEREKSEGFSNPIRVTLLKTSTIEVYSNNHLIKTRTNVAPGTYVLDDISYNNGKNDIKIKIIDESGREEILDESFFYENSYVPQGKFTFSGSYGYPESNDPIKGRYDKENPLMSVTLKYGLLPSVEIGLGLLKNKAGKTLSYEIRNKNVLGHFDFKFATSNYKEINENLSGKVFYAQYSSPSINIFDKTSLSFSASIEKSDNFFRPYLAAKEENFDTKNEFFSNFLKKEENIKGKSTTISYRTSLSDVFSCGVGFSYYQKKSFDKEPIKYYSFDISRGFSINNNWFSSANVSANFSRGYDEGGKKSKTFSIYCSLSLKNHANLSSGYSKSNDGYNSYVSMSHSPEGTNFSYDITAEKSKYTNSAKINTHYYNEIFVGNLSYAKNNQGSNSANVGLESALYFADGRFAVSRTNYSDGGFVIVTPKQDLEKIKFLGKDIESGFLGGGAVLSNSRISSSISRIDLREIPDNINLKQDTIVSQGQYKRGFFVDIQGTKSIMANGILVDSQGKPLEQVTGFAINKDNTDEMPVSFFTNSDGEFSLMELRPGKYKLTINVQNVENIELEIKETKSEDEILDLGTIVCKDSIEGDKNDEDV